MAEMKRKLVQVNLVPDVKQELINAQRLRNRVITISVLVGIIAVAITVVLASITFGAQQIVLSSQEKNIDKGFEEFKNKPGVDQVLTLQNQLSKINSLHDSKPITSRVFNLIVTMLSGETKDIKISKIQLNSDTGEIFLEAHSVEGFSAVEKLQKTILETYIQYQDGDNPDMIKEHLTDKVNITEDSVYGDNLEKQKVLMFKLNFALNQNFLNNNITNLKIVSVGRKNATDSFLAIPENIFEKQASQNDQTDELGEEINE